jgi:RNA polymerase sigma-70 factor (ECF subfamily)
MTDASFDAVGCLARVRSGDPAAARELVERNDELVAKIVRAYLPRDADRDACRQEVFIRAFAKLDAYRAEAPWEHWLSRIAVNACLDVLRARRRRRELRFADLGEAEAEAVAAAVAAVDESVPDAVAARETIDKMLECLDPEDAVIVRMLDIEERSTDEIAALLGRSRTLVKVRAFRARRKLRGMITRLIVDPDDDAISG